jgi:hypothetical protein
MVRTRVQPDDRLPPGQHRTRHRPPENWKLLATGYRGLLDRFPTFLDAITKLEIYRTS